jgi:drug/metabolite transporter (DMT)-like permease
VDAATQAIADGQMKLSHLWLLLILNCGWATVPTVATRLEGLLSPREFVFLRYALAFAGLLLLWPWLPGRMPRGRDFWRTAVMGIVVFNVGHLLQIAGIQLSRASDASILLALDPLVSSLGAALFLHERIPVRRWCGFAAAIAGVIVMSMWRRGGPLPGLLANLLIVMSFVSEAVWSVMGKPLVGRWGIPKVAGLALGAGTLANMLLLVPDAASHAAVFREVPGSAWVTLGFLGVFLTSFGYCAWYLVIREVPVSVAAMTIYLQPLVGTAMAVLWTGERLHLGHVAGGAAILAGLVIGMRDREGSPAPVVAVVAEK